MSPSPMMRDTRTPEQKRLAALEKRLLPKRKGLIYLSPLETQNEVRGL